MAKDLYTRALGQTGAEHAPDSSEREQPHRHLQPLHILEGHTKLVYSLASIPDSDLFISGSYDGTCRVWNAKDGGEVGKRMVHGESIHAIVVSRDGKTMASGGNGRKIVVWSLESREKIIEWKTSSNFVWSLAMSQNSQTLASGHGDGNVMLWNASTGDPIFGPYKLHAGGVHALSFFANESQIVSASFGSSHIRATYCRSGEDVIPPFKAHDKGVRSLVQLPNGQLISASKDRAIKFWDTSNSSPLMATSRRHTSSVFALAISSDGKLLASASLDQTVKLWKTTTHKQIDASLFHPTPLLSVALSSDGYYLAAAGYDHKLYIWNLETINRVAKVIDKPEREDPKSDSASDVPNWLNLPATQPPDMSREIAQVSPDAFFGGMEVRCSIYPAMNN
ncbi:hypothetical protein PAXRUDRAFT_829038 [Paxillus rubicundulus Ve08.2h10]|uniref:WD40 repeat-like protein n=1 Tax=Paxillus rubicundulus Ve08.2h10 TaxID=930991 RepID=A0A0D0D8V2_9AGAM|nr:hypothetical protein PAXRUDRAFT_829038 [Paxillus rubicundulus Ve08.2h10]